MWTTLNERQSRFLRPALQPPNTGLASLMRGLKDLLTRCLSISRNSVFREPRVFAASERQGNGVARYRFVPLYLVAHIN